MGTYYERLCDSNVCIFDVSYVNIVNTVNKQIMYIQLEYLNRNYLYCIHTYYIIQTGCMIQIQTRPQCKCLITTAVTCTTHLLTISKLPHLGRFNSFKNNIHRKYFKPYVWFTEQNIFRIFCHNSDSPIHHIILALFRPF